jgi:hypothetical protein
MQRPDSSFGGKMVVFGGDFRQCPPVVSRGSRAAIVFAALSRSVLWHEVRVLTLTENMRLRVDPLAKPYVEYLLKVGNGQESSIIDHFPPKVNAKPSVRVEICRNPTLAKCGGEAQHLEKLGVGVLRDSRMFRARQQGAKHLALGCS